MASIRSILENVWNKSDDFCCLCFSSDIGVYVHVEDEVLISYYGNESFLPVAELLCSVLGYENLDYLLTFELACKLCIQSAIDSYNFMKSSKFNLNLLSNAINGLSTSLENTEDEIGNCKTLFVSLNTEDFTSKQFYDTKKQVTNILMAHSRFSMLNSLNINPKREESNLPIKKESIEEKPKIHGNCVVLISTKDMIYDKNDSLIRCKECLKTFTSTLSLRNHYIKLHAPKVYKCSECRKGFGSPSVLEVHKSESHSKIVCSECGKTFKSKQSFKAHELSHDITIVCHDCGRTYKNKSTYKKHKEFNVCGQKTRASPANAKYTCDYCNKKYTQKMSLRVHIQYEHGNYKPHVCNVCNKNFWAQSRLKAHMVKHTKEKNFICSLCAGKFVTKEALLYHTRIHTGEKPYECSNCDARFLSASRRSEHIKRQHMNATFQCDLCGSKFSSQNYLQKHKKTHFSASTSKEPTDCRKEIQQKVNEVELIEYTKYTQELKRISNEDYKMSDQNEIYLEFDL